MLPLLRRVCLVQAVTLLGLTGYIVVRAFGPGIRSPGLLLMVAAFAGIAAVLLLVGLRALEGGRRWPRTPLGLLEVLAVLTSTGLLEAGDYAYGTLVGVPGLLVLVGLVATVRTPAP